jgi:hypothetical protein
LVHLAIVVVSLKFCKLVYLRVKFPTRSA